MSTEQLPSDPDLTSYLEGFDAALDSAPITCARCASLEKELQGVMEWIDNWDPNFIHDEAWPETRRAIVDLLNGAHRHG